MRNADLAIEIEMFAAAAKKAARAADYISIHLKERRPDAQVSDERMQGLINATSMLEAVAATLQSMTRNRD